MVWRMLFPSRPLPPAASASTSVDVVEVVARVAGRTEDPPPSPGGTRPSWGARCFNRMLILMGVRSPWKTLVDVDASGRHLVEHFRDWFRLYSACVFASYCVAPVYHALELGNGYTDMEAMSFLSASLVPLHFLLACGYFCTKHIEQYYDVVKPVGRHIHTDAPDLRDIYVHIQREDRDRNLEFSVLIRQPCRITIRVVTFVVCLLSVCTFAVSMRTMDFRGVEPSVIPFLVVSKLLGRATVINNTTTFCFVFYKHVKVLNIYADILEHQRWSTSRDHRCSVILVNLIRIKESLRISSSLLKTIFSSATLTGSFITGVCAHVLTVERTHSYDMAVILAGFVNLQVVFFYVIYRLSTAKSRIEDVVSSSSFASKFLSRKVKYDTESRVSEIATTQDWMVITRILKDEWLDFRVMGLPLHSGAFVKQMITFTLTFLIVTKNGGFQLDTLVDFL
jgi:hypothetical protein